jgi:hypothetical protein
LRFYEKIGTVRLRIGMNDFFAELKRRNVYKVALAYIVAGWALSQGIAQVLPFFNVPNWIIRLIVLLIIIGLPIALALAWTFELTPHGIKRTADVDLAGERSRSRAWVYIVVYLSEFCPRQARPPELKEIMGLISITSNARQTGHHSAGGPLVSISYLWHKLVPSCSIVCFQQNGGVELKR